MFQRLINPIKSNSFFLFGARGTGKSTFIKQFFKDKDVLWFDLLDLNVEDEIRRDPKTIHHQIEAKQGRVEWVVIDEVQKIPELLNLVHQLIESTKIKFALTGSSARKLKRGHANLLAGRAFVNHLFPLTHLEMKEKFQLEEALNRGTLPKLSHLKTKKEKRAFLRAYAQTYLKEEVWDEHLIRKLNPFRRFLEIAAQTNSEIVNYSNIAKDVGADTKTVQSYFEILEDTLLGFFLEPYHQSIRKQQRMSPKFYFFDTGVKRALDRTITQELVANTYGFGKAFEHFFMAEIFRLNTYLEKDYKFSYLKTKDQAEVDLIIERPGSKTVLIEIKSSEQVDERDIKSLKHFLKDFKNSEAFVFSRDPKEKKIDNIYALPWYKGLDVIGLTRP